MAKLIKISKSKVVGNAINLMMFGRDFKVDFTGRLGVKE